MNKDISKPKLSVSIADFPIFISHEEAFKCISNSGADGIEMMVGLKNRFSLKNITRLSSKYNIPILSIHEPIYSWFGYVYDERVVKIAAEFNALYVSHPVFAQPLTSRENTKRFEWLSKLKEKYSVKIAVENMAKEFSRPFLRKLVPVDDSVSKLIELKKIYEKHNLGFNFDVSHLEEIRPWENKDFLSVEKHMQSIHLSDFAPLKQHLFIGDGIFDTKGFINHLEHIKYGGLITLELTDKLFMNKEKYFEGVTRSVKKVREYLG